MANKRSIFAGADDTYLTKKNIAVKRLSSTKDSKGNWTLVEKTTYVPKTVGNLNEAKKIHGYIRKGK